MLLAVLTASSMLVFGILLQAAHLRSAEADLHRGVRAAAEGVLSCYSGVLLQRYGLLAVDRTRDDLWKERSGRIFVGSLTPMVAGCELDYEEFGTFGDRGALREAIATFVSERLPAATLAMALERSGTIARAGSEVFFDPMSDASFSSDADEWRDRLAELLAREEEGPGEEGGRGPETGIAGASASLKECFVEIARINREAASDASSPRLPSPLEPEAQAGFVADVLGRAAGFVGAGIGGIAVDLYAATMFHSRVDSYESGGIRHDLRDLRGRPISTVSSVERCEIERIIAGKANEEDNRASVERAVLVLRMALHLLADSLDERKREEASLLGASLSAMLSAATSGSLSIPPDFLAMAVLAAWAYQAASEDTSRLVEGKTVPFLPAALAARLSESFRWESTYPDHLTLLLLSLPDDVEIERIASLIERNVRAVVADESGDSGSSDAPPLSGFLISVRCATTFRGHRYSHPARYLDAAAP